MHRRADELQARLKALEEAEKQERRVRLNMRTKLTGLREHSPDCISTILCSVRFNNNKTLSTLSQRP